MAEKESIAMTSLPDKLLTPRLSSCLTPRDSQRKSHGAVRIDTSVIGTGLVFRPNTTNQTSCCWCRRQRISDVRQAAGYSGSVNAEAACLHKSVPLSLRSSL